MKCLVSRIGCNGESKQQRIESSEARKQS